MDVSKDGHIILQSFLLMAWAYEHIAIIRPLPFPLARGEMFPTWFRWAGPANSFGYEVESWRVRFDSLIDDEVCWRPYLGYNWDEDE